MRKWVVPMLVALLFFGGQTASADVSVKADVYKKKDIDIVETIYVLKVVTIKAIYLRELDKAAESSVIVDQVNMKNQACTNCDEKTDTLADSVNSNSGVVSTNQSAGNMNNQANAVSAAVDAAPVIIGPPSDPPTPPANGGQGFAQAQSALEQENGAKVRKPVKLEVGHGEAPHPWDLFGLPGFEVDRERRRGYKREGGNDVTTVNILFREALVSNSINSNTGIAHVNQSPGNMNNQANALSLALSLEDNGAALAESDLGQVNMWNRVRESDTVGTTINTDTNDPDAGETIPALVGINKLATITGSINSNSGIVGVNQAVGNMANQANNVSAAFVTSGP